jgi:NADH:ubiquinone oxidoreductase subunit E
MRLRLMRGVMVAGLVCAAAPAGVWGARLAPAASEGIVAASPPPRSGGRAGWLLWLPVLVLGSVAGLQARPKEDGAPKAASPPIDLTFVDELVRREGRSPEAAIPILQAIQEHYRYLPDEAMRRVCELTEITPAQIAGTSSFYTRFRRSPVGKHIVRVCHGTACHVAGAGQINEELRRALNIPEGADTDDAREFTVEEVACLGCCSLAPVVMVDERTSGKLTRATARGVLTAAQKGGRG